MLREYAEDRELWHACQRLAWPRQGFVSDGPPYARGDCSSARRPASWLYWTLLDDPELRVTVLPE